MVGCNRNLDGEGGHSSPTLQPCAPPCQSSLDQGAQHNLFGLVLFVLSRTFTFISGVGQLCPKLCRVLHHHVHSRDWNTAPSSPNSSFVHWHLLYKYFLQRLHSLAHTHGCRQVILTSDYFSVSCFCAGVNLHNNSQLLIQPMQHKQGSCIWFTFDRFFFSRGGSCNRPPPRQHSSLP